MHEKNSCLIRSLIKTKRAHNLSKSLKNLSIIKRVETRKHQTLI